MGIQKIPVDRPIWQDTVRGARKQVGISMIHINVRTNFDYPPIPVRNFDWSAVDDDTYDGEGCPIGHGATEQEAIADLLEQIEERAA